MKLVESGRKAVGNSYDQYDKPTVIRQGREVGEAAGRAVAGNTVPEGDMDYLDIPAFLRRQAD